MTASLFILQRHEDPTGVSGTGVVAAGVEFDDGSVALRWAGGTPTTSVWSDIRHVEKVHGHDGATEVQYMEPHRLIAAYEQVTKVFLQQHNVRGYTPLTAAPHPDHPDRLRLTFANYTGWLRWVGELGGDHFASVREEVNGEIEHRWVSPDGNLWLVYYTKADNKVTWESHDDPEVTR